MSLSQLALDRRPRVVPPRRIEAFAEVLRHIDLLLVLSTLAVAAMGVIMVYSATQAKLTQAGIDRHYYLDRQTAFAIVGFVLMVAFAAVDYRWVTHLGNVAYVAIVLGLLGVLAVGQSALGSTRWFALGSFQLQPSAFASLALILFVAAHCQRHPPTGFLRLLVLLVLLAIPILLVIKQPDLGSAIVITVSVLAMLVVGGVKFRYLVALAVLASVGIVLVLHLGFLKQYQLARLEAFAKQGHATTAAQKNVEVKDALYDLNQSQTAIGSGSVLGKGLFHGTLTNLSYVPEEQTDFIFTAVGEQLGFAGAATLLGLFAIMLWRIWRTARLSKDQLGRLLCVGVLATLAFSMFENIGMTMGIMPITGIPLPFMSYGGSALLAEFASIGLVLNVAMRRFRYR
ncbi:MAG: rod shape-determining protein RodA [Acidimicrobiales bacterium]|nr:rod shape-determining protein RodA [Acidimicrobiales bacterium]MBO0894766.1 rod shape-determining protein RodA [Acidimicrobiales bacterium]